MKESSNKQGILSKPNYVLYHSTHFQTESSLVFYIISLFFLPIVYITEGTKAEEKYA